jgi:hypothetical protein
MTDYHFNINLKTNKMKKGIVNLLLYVFMVLTLGLIMAVIGVKVYHMITSVLACLWFADKSRLITKWLFKK